MSPLLVSFPHPHPDPLPLCTKRKLENLSTLKVRPKRITKHKQISAAFRLHRDVSLRCWMIDRDWRLSHQTSVGDDATHALQAPNQKEAFIWCAWSKLAPTDNWLDVRKSRAKELTEFRGKISVKTSVPAAVPFHPDERPWGLAPLCHSFNRICLLQG